MKNILFFFSSRPGNVQKVFKVYKKSEPNYKRLITGDWDSVKALLASVCVHEFSDFNSNDFRKTTARATAGVSLVTKELSQFSSQLRFSLIFV